MSGFDPSKYLIKVNRGVYLPVAARLLWLREDYPESIIETEVVALTDEWAAFKATVTLVGGVAIDKPRADGHGHCAKSSFNDYVEKAETKAIGRALAAVGLGTQFVQDFDEGDTIADSPINIYDGAKTTAPLSQPAAQAMATPNQIAYVKRLLDEHNMDWPDNIDRLGKSEASAMIDSLKA